MSPIRHEAIKTKPFPALSSIRLFTNQDILIGKIYTCKISTVVMFWINYFQSTGIIMLKQNIYRHIYLKARYTRTAATFHGRKTSMKTLLRCTNKFDLIFVKLNYIHVAWFAITIISYIAKLICLIQCKTLICRAHHDIFQGQKYISTAANIDLYMAIKRILVEIR